jgi:NTE family protein
VTRLFTTPEGKEIDVQLVDGGVHDNQGIAALLEFDCNPIVVSDASGYFPDDPNPATRIPAVGGRTLGLYGDRVREEQLMNARIDDDERPLGLIHLRKGIVGYALAPLGKEGRPLDEPRREPPDDFGGERFDIDPRVQRLLSRVRTDLDSFSQVEAYSLMVDGYRQTGPNVDHLQVEGATPLSSRGQWRFESVARPAASGDHGRYMRHLGKSNSRFGKAIALSTPARVAALALAVAALAGIVALFFVDAVRGVFTASVPVWVVLAVVAAELFLAILYLGSALPAPLKRLGDFLFTQVVPVLLAVPLWLGAFATLGFSRAFLAAGRVERVLGRD